MKHVFVAFSTFLWYFEIFLLFPISRSLVRIYVHSIISLQNVMCISNTTSTTTHFMLNAKKIAAMIWKCVYVDKRITTYNSVYTNKPFILPFIPVFRRFCCYSCFGCRCWFFFMCFVFREKFEH